MDLLQLHSDPTSKIGSGIEYWTVEYNGPRNGGRHLGFYLHRHDGTEDDFGFSKVIKGDSPQNRVRGALANAIRDIMQQVRYEAFEHPPVFCARTKTIIKKREGAMVIHQEPAWGVLCDEFVRSRGGYENIKLERRDGYYGHYPADDAIVEAFRCHQLRHLQGLAISCNPDSRP